MGDTETALAYDLGFKDGLRTALKAIQESSAEGSWYFESLIEGLLKEEEERG